MTESTSRSVDFNQPTVVALVYLASLFTWLPMLIGFVLAYVGTGSGAGWEDSHLRFHIRSFWIGLLFAVLALVPTIFTLGLAGYVIYPLLALWPAVRTIRVLLAAPRHAPIVNVEPGPGNVADHRHQYLTHGYARP